MRDKAYLYEIGVGRGRLLASSLDFAANYAVNPATRYLMSCMLEYAAGKRFRPEIRVTESRFRKALRSE